MKQKRNLQKELTMKKSTKDTAQQSTAQKSTAQKSKAQKSTYSYLARDVCPESLAFLRSYAKENGINANDYAQDIFGKQTDELTNVEMSRLISSLRRIVLRADAIDRFPENYFTTFE